MGRWIRFFLAMALGSALGALYGWVANPVKYTDTTPAALREDYRSDYVLMVAEAYQAEGDLSLAARRLALLGDAPPVEIVREAMVYGSQAPYADTDMDLLARLGSDLQTWSPVQGVPQPGEGQP